MFETLLGYSGKDTQESSIDLKREEFESFIKDESEALAFNRYLQDKQDYDYKIQFATTQLELKLDEHQQLKKDPIKVLHHSTYYEFQTHLIYQQSPVPLLLPSILQTQNLSKAIGSFLPQLNLCSLILDK